MKQEQTIKQRPANSTYSKVAVQRLNHPDSYRDCAFIKVCTWLTVKYFKIATFG
jgi:hypothetical protein